jgi:hypothetical protein
LCEFGVPLIGFSADEAVEVVEALMGGPMIVRAGVCGFCVRDALLNGDQSAVGDSDAVGVATEIAQRVLRSAEGRLGIDAPVVTEQRS